MFGRHSARLRAYEIYAGPCVSTAPGTSRALSNENSLGFDGYAVCFRLCANFFAIVTLCTLAESRIGVHDFWSCALFSAVWSAVGDSVKCVNVPGSGFTPLALVRHFALAWLFPSLVGWEIQPNAS